MLRYDYSYYEGFIQLHQALQTQVFQCCNQSHDRTQHAPQPNNITVLFPSTPIFIINNKTMGRIILFKFTVKLLSFLNILVYYHQSYGTKGPIFRWPRIVLHTKKEKKK